MAYITTAERIGLEKGYAQGIQAGMQQGKQEGEYELLLRLLERKFQHLSPDYRQRLAQADAATLLGRALIGC